MDLLNGINLYSIQSMQIKQKVKESLTGEETGKTETKTTTTQVNKKISANDVLDFMTQQSVCMRVDVKQTLNINKNSSAEQYERIGNMMKNFEEYVDNGLEMFNDEFKNFNLSDDAKLGIVLKSADKTYF